MDRHGDHRLAPGQLRPYRRIPRAWVRRGLRGHRVGRNQRGR